MIVAHVVCRNEAGRWLDATLGRLLGQFNGLVAVYDDQSTDATLDIAVASGCFATRRPDDVPAWAEHEGQCREAAYRWTIDLFDMKIGDVIVVVDADEALAGDPVTAIEKLRGSYPNVAQFEVPIEETWKLAGSTPMIRIDKQWGSITGRRVCVVTGEEPLFPAVSRACGTAPITTHPKYHATEPRLWHLGYLRPEDRQAKHHRYTTGAWARRGRGHQRGHVASILTSPTLRQSIGLSDADRAWWAQISRELAA